MPTWRSAVLALVVLLSCVGVGTLLDGAFFQSLGNVSGLVIALGICLTSAHRRRA